MNKDFQPTQLSEIERDVLTEGGLPKYDKGMKKTEKKYQNFKEKINRNWYNPKQANVLVIGTGGTFQSDQLENGRLAAECGLEESMKALNLPKDPRINLQMLDLMRHDSAKLNVDQWRVLADRIADLLMDTETRYYFDGIIVTHGTDTMAEAACYLSYMLQGLKKPIIFTGSQKPALYQKTDAKKNMERCLDAMKLAKEEHIAEVMVLCGKMLVRGTWVEKRGDETTDAFRPWLDTGNHRDLEVIAKAGDFWKNAPALLDFGQDIPENELHFRSHARKINPHAPFSPFTKILSRANIVPIKLTDLSVGYLRRLVSLNTVSIIKYLGSGTAEPTLARFIHDAAVYSGKAIVLQPPFSDSTKDIGEYDAGAILAEANLPVVNTTDTSLIAKINFLRHRLDLQPISGGKDGDIFAPEDLQNFYLEVARDLVGELVT